MAIEKVRYRVLAPAFVNGSYVEPRPKAETFVFAGPGLEGVALQLAPEAGEQPPPAETDPADAPPKPEPRRPKK